MMGNGQNIAVGSSDIGPPGEAVKRKRAKMAQDYALMKAKIENDPMFTISGGHGHR